MSKRAFRLVNNPLVHTPNIPNGAPALDVIEAKHFLPAIDWAIDKARANIAAITANPDAPSFENTVEALEFADQDVSRIKCVLENLGLSYSTKALQKAEEKVLERVSAFANDVMFNKDLFERVKDVYDRRTSLTLTPEQTTLLERTYKNFTRSGVDLPQAMQDRLREIDRDLSALTTKFENNNTEAAGAYEKIIDDEAMLEGIPEREKKALAERADKAGHPGKWLISLAPPPITVLEYAENRDLREELYRAQFTNTADGGQYDNRDITLEIVRLRHEKAQILGFENHAEYIISDRMARKPETVMDMLEENRVAYMTAAKKEIDELSALALQRDGVTDIAPWDQRFYERLLKEQKHDVDIEETKAYFELGNVTKGLLRHAEKLFDIEFKDAGGKYPVYDDDVNVYEVHNRKSGELIGVLYTDYYARPGRKKGGAWKAQFRDRGLDENGQDQIPLVTNNCTFDKPPEGEPTLLSIVDVETMFHELGHGLHSLLGKGRYPSLTGTSVLYDFVELPSQLMENWVLEDEVLDTFAVHHETGAPMPKDMVEKIRALNKEGNGLAGLRQTFFGLLDMTWHTTDPDDIHSVEQLEEGIYKNAQVYDWKGLTQSPGFGHLFSDPVGYSAGYYGYKWAEILDADVFTLFQKNGLYDPETSRNLREIIYEKGDTEAPDKLFRDLMGRDPDPQALMRREGFVDDADGQTASDQAQAPQRARKRGGPE